MVSINRTGSTVPSGTVITLGAAGMFDGAGPSAGAFEVVAVSKGGVPLEALLAADLEPEPKPPVGPFDTFDRGAGCEVRLAIRPDRRVGVGSAAGASGAGAASATCGMTCRLFTTVRTPATCAASLAAAVRSASLCTVPLNVTTPLSACT